jgi:hypothetical protein
VNRLFDSAWLKWGWAVKHGKALDADIKAWTTETEGQRLFTAATEYDPKRHCFVLRVNRVVPMPATWGLMLGDTLGNLRSCLDQTAWAVVRRGKTPNLPERKANKVYFPLKRSDQAFTDCLPTNLPGVKLADSTLIRRYQPYASGKRNLARHAFTPLAKLTSDDKHRTVQPVLMSPTGVRWEVLEIKDCTITRVPGRPAQPLEVGAEIHRIYVKKSGPNPQLKMNAHAILAPALDERLWLRDYLTEAVSFAGRMLREFAEPPEELFSLGPEIPARPWPEVPPWRP